MTDNTTIEQAYWAANFWDAVCKRDIRMDGAFFYAVLSTGVYCRPSCPARRPKRENVLFFERRENVEQAGFRPCLRCRPEEEVRRDSNAELVKSVSRYIEQHLDAPVTLSTLSRKLGLSPFHLQRTFKAMTGITPRGYADFCRLKGLKAGLRDGHSVTRALYDAGYGSSSRLYERTASQLGMTPATYRRAGRGMLIRYAVTHSPLGPMLLAATDRGVCSIRFGDSDTELECALRAEFSAADITRDQPRLAPCVDALRAYFEGLEAPLSLPLDIQATAFQRRVWEYLQSIPYGKTETYAQVAVGIGRPQATRAVAQACAKNPVAVAVPCHRVVRRDGTLGGYRWGLERKKALLALEGE